MVHSCLINLRLLNQLSITYAGQDSIAMAAASRFSRGPTLPRQYGRITLATTTLDGRVWRGRRSFSETRELTSLLCWKVMLQSRIWATTTWRCGSVNDCRCMWITGRRLATTRGGNAVLCAIVLIVFMLWVYLATDSSVVMMTKSYVWLTRSIWIWFLLILLQILPSVLWHCWLGGRKGIQPVKNWVVGCWRSYLSGARCRLAYGPADVTATHSLLLQ